MLIKHKFSSSDLIYLFSALTRLVQFYWALAKSKTWINPVQFLSAYTQVLLTTLMYISVGLGLKFGPECGIELEFIFIVFYSLTIRFAYFFQFWAFRTGFVGIFGAGLQV